MSPATKTACSLLSQALAEITAAGLGSHPSAPAEEAGAAAHFHAVVTDPRLGSLVPVGVMRK